MKAKDDQKKQPDEDPPWSQQHLNQGRGTHSIRPLYTCQVEKERIRTENTMRVNHEGSFIPTDEVDVSEDVSHCLCAD